MYFDSFEALLHMDGHGAFVWTAYLITMVVVAAILIAPGRRKKKFLQQQGSFVPDNRPEPMHENRNGRWETEVYQRCGCRPDRPESRRTA